MVDIASVTKERRAEHEDRRTIGLEDRMAEYEDRRTIGLEDRRAEHEDRRTIGLEDRRAEYEDRRTIGLEDRTGGTNHLLTNIYNVYKYAPAVIKVHTTHKCCF